MKRKLFMFLTLFLAGIGILTAQTQVRGTVVDEAGIPIIGATIQIKGTAQGTVTDLDGRFTLSAPANATLVISYVGLTTQEVPVRPSVNVTLLPDTELLQEVVVTALGISREKKSLGYSVAEVSADEMIKSRGGVTNPINSLVGKVSGLQISGSTGNMGGSSKILIRGAQSISGNNQPLFVIDGVPIEGTDYNTTDAARGAGGYDYGNLIQDINPDDIESISVLKGPNASALYGSRATNGVVMIVTKKGASHKGLGISFNTGIGFEKVNKLPVMQTKYGGGYSLGAYDEDGEPLARINGVDYNI
ncbi:MAG: TonB-dependent receptor plug domain-containing protein, partial [Petrimonas sp.]|nr:TonB-dependent receptor plug domain-containing protein [Petrimonas sp.]